jgi:hypothetical protein
VSAAESLLGRAFTKWPDWRCIAIDASTGSVCGARATWQQKPTDQAATAWTYCDRCRPDGAEAIAPDAPYYVTRLELRVAVTGAPGNRAAAAEEAIRRIAYAVESVGGLIVGIKVPGKAASPAAATSPPLRLQLAGQPEPLGVKQTPATEARSELGRWRWRGSRTG